MIQVDKFCCCSLKTGAIIVGVLLLIFGIITAAGSIYFLTGGKPFFLADLGIDQYSTDVKHAVTSSTIAALISSIIDIAASSCLLYGADMGNPDFVLPILVLVPVVLAVDWISAIVL